MLLRSSALTIGLFIPLCHCPGYIHKWMAQLTQQIRLMICSERKYKRIWKDKDQAKETHFIKNKVKVENEIDPVQENEEEAE